MLFDKCSIYSYMYVQFASTIAMICDIIDASIHVSTYLEISHSQPCLSCMSNLFMGFETLANMVILDMNEFDILLGITLLSTYYNFLN